MNVIFLIKRKAAQLVSIMLLLVTIPNVALAQLTPGTDPIFEKIYEAIVGIAQYLTPVASYQRDQDYQLPPDVGHVTAATVSMRNNQTYINSAINNQLAQTSWGMLNNSVAATKIFTQMVSRPAADYPAPCLVANTSAPFVADANNCGGTPKNPTYTHATAEQVMAGNLDYNVDSLLGNNYLYIPKDPQDSKQGYAVLGQIPAVPVDVANLVKSNSAQSTFNTNLPAPQDHAMNYIYYLTGLAHLQPTLSYSELTDAGQSPADVQDDPKVQEYRYAIRNNVALSNLALSNFYHMYYDRIPIADLGRQAGMSPQNDPIYPNASIRQVEQHMATRRMNVDWYQKMSAASPAAVERETLFLLAEMRQEQYQQRVATERLNATMSALLMTMAGMAQQQNQVAANNAKPASSQIPPEAADKLPPTPEEQLKQQQQNPGSSTGGSDNSNQDQDSITGQ